MQMSRIRFHDDASEAKGLVELAKRVRVICLPDDLYIIPKKSLTLLEELKIPYILIKEEGLDHALHALRNSHSSHLFRAKA
jgi:hypothetical protein